MDSTEEFLNYLRFEKRYSPHTVQSYSTDLRQFSLFAEDFTGKGNLCEDGKIIRLWLAQLMSDGVTPRSVNRKITALRSFYKFLVREKRISTNPMSRIQGPRVAHRLPSFVEEKQMDLLFDEVDFGDDYPGIRNRLIVAMFYHTGMRLSELTGIRDGDIRLSEMTIRVIGKRNKERILPLTVALKELILQYLEIREQSFPTASSFFLTDKGKPVYSRLVYRVVNKALDSVTTLSKKSPHVIRHTFATHMLNRGADLNAIKELLGHANLAATQVYTHNTFDKLRKVYKRAHPRAEQ
ncbi:MAG: tyrosine-type recombinase/integrase [Bacteroidales bacterium]